MRLGELVKKMQESEEVLVLNDKADPVIAQLYYDNRKIVPGSPGGIFACVKGGHTDGHDFAASAVKSGCVALLCEHAMPLDVPQIVVKDVRSSMGNAAAILCGNPSRKMTMVALTGTNGKTTTAYITRSIFRAFGWRTGMLGTIVYDDSVCETDAARTTPEGPDIQDMLFRMVENGADACVMEASSHGLDQGRLNGCFFDRAGFSNLTPEHLEYHSDMESYYRAKRLLFTNYMRQTWKGAINLNDPYGVRLFDEFPESVFGFTLKEDAGVPSRRRYRGIYKKTDISGTTLDIVYPDGQQYEIKSPLIGTYNASNILESISIADSLGIGRDIIHKGVAGCPQVPGRLEHYRLSNDVSVFVDYAHSPDGMENVLATLSMICPGRLWVVWGAGGDRSPAKRPLVGGIMAKFAPHVIITTDNPRSEEPAAIAKQVESGVLSSAANVEYKVILDRKEAIFFALEHAKPLDVVLIAGKGPENFIDYGTHKVPFSDSGTLLMWIAENRSGVRRCGS